jgi:hypothetical protein
MEENEYHRQSLVLEALIGHDVWASQQTLFGPD